MNLRLTLPDVVGDLTDQLQLGNHVVPDDSVALVVTGKSALWADSNTIQGFFDSLVVALGDEFGGFQDALLHLFLVLQLGELASHDTQDDILVLGQDLEGLEATSTGSVVLKVVSINIQLLEELDGNTVIATLRKVTAVDEVTTAQVDTNVEVSGALSQAVIVQLDVLVEQVIGRVLV